MYSSPYCRNFITLNVVMCVKSRNKYSDQKTERPDEKPDMKQILDDRQWSNFHISNYRLGNIVL